MLDICHEMPGRGGGADEPLPGVLLLDRGHGDVAVVTLFGEHDLRTRDAIRRTLFGIVEEGALPVLDLSAADYIDSCVLNAAVDTDGLLHRRGARLVLLLGTAAIVDRALVVSGLSEALPCAREQEAAVALARSLARGH
ncbi:MAG: hypothetical protein U0237_14965 [Thermoleophilia bacterium]